MTKTLDKQLNGSKLNDHSLGLSPGFSRAHSPALSDRCLSHSADVLLYRSVVCVLGLQWFVRHNTNNSNTTAGKTILMWELSEVAHIEHRLSLAWNDPFWASIFDFSSKCNFHNNTIALLSKAVHTRAQGHWALGLPHKHTHFHEIACRLTLSYTRRLAHNRIPELCYKTDAIQTWHSTHHTIIIAIIPMIRSEKFTQNVVI